MEVPWEEASRFGIMAVDENDMITEFTEKPHQPKSNLASMGIYVFSWQALRWYLTEDEANPASENDFGKNIIPRMLADGQRMAAFRFQGYWKDVGTLTSLWDANMDMLSPESGLDLLDESWPFTPGPSTRRRPFWAAAARSATVLSTGAAIWRGRWRTPSWLPMSPWGRGPGCPTPSCSPG